MRRQTEQIAAFVLLLLFEQLVWVFRGRGALLCLEFNVSRTPSRDHDNGLLAKLDPKV